MAQWRKVIVSGSDAELNTLQVGGGSGGSGVTVSTLGAVTADAAITAGSSFIIGSADINETDLEKIDGITDGTATANKALVVDGNKDIGTLRNLTIDGTFSDGNYTFDTSGNVSGLGTVGCGAITTSGNLAVTGTITGDTSLTLDAVTISTAEIGVLDSVTAGTAAASKAVVLDASKNIATIGTIGSGAITSTGASTFGSISNASTVAASKMSGSFTGSFTGDGSNLTGVAQDIELLDPYGAATLHQTEDKFLVSDNGTEKSITFSNLEDSIFANVSGDVLIAAGGAATIQANSVALGTDTTGNYMTDLSAGALIDVTHTPAEGSTGTIAVDLTEAAEGAIADGDYILFLDGGATGTHAKEALADVTTLFAGDGLQAASSVMAVDVSDFAGTGLEDDGSENLRLATQGTGISGGAGSTLSITPAQTAITSIYNTALKIGRASGDTYIDMGTADDNIDFYAGATKIIDLTTSGIDVTGALTVSSNATIEGNLIVNGDTTTLSTTNLAVGDQFIFAATGSAGTNVDAGLIVQSGSAVDSGSALYHDTTSERWAVASGVSSIAQAVTPGQMVTTTTLSTSEPGSSDGDYGVGEMWVDTDDQTIWVRTA